MTRERTFRDRQLGYAFSEVSDRPTVAPYYYQRPSQHEKGETYRRRGELAISPSLCSGGPRQQGSNVGIMICPWLRLTAAQDFAYSWARQASIDQSISQYVALKEAIVPRHKFGSYLIPPILATLTL